MSPELNQTLQNNWPKDCIAYVCGSIFRKIRVSNLMPGFYTCVTSSDITKKEHPWERIGVKKSHFLHILFTLALASRQQGSSGSKKRGDAEVANYFLLQCLKIQIKVHGYGILLLTFIEFKLCGPVLQQTKAIDN